MEPQEWELKDLLAGEDQGTLKRYLDAIESDVKRVESFRGRLGEKTTSEEIKTLLEAKERVAENISRLSSYAYLKIAAHTDSDASRALASRFSQLEASVSNRILFFTHWWKDVDDAYAKRIEKDLPRYRQMLFEVRRLKEHFLTEPEEKIINIKDVTGREALIKQYDLQTSSYRYKVKVGGRVRTFFDSQMHALITDKDPTVRSEAYKAYHAVYEQHQNELCDIYRNRVIDWKQEQIELRKYKGPIDARNKCNDIPDEAVDMLLKAIKDNKKIFSEYLLLKGKILGIKKMSRDHIYAPLAKTQKLMPFEEGVSLTLDSFAEFSSQMRDLANNVLKSKHLDSQVRVHKEGGAFCLSPLPKMVPFVLQSYNNRWNDVSTLAHELGHAVHSQLAKDHSIFVSQAPMPLAETASIFGEILLEKSYLRKVSDLEKASIIANRLDGLYASICRQGYFTLFEIKAHQMLSDGAQVSELCDEYYKNLQDQFGDIEVPKHFRYEWLRIPHFFHYPFYVYAYSFGNLLVLALYQKYQEEGKSFVPKYLKLLSYGGSQRPQVMLKELGIDICDESFWQGGLDVIKGMVDELRTLVR